MEFFSNEPTEKWTCKEVCDYYINKNKDKSLSTILSKIKTYLVHFNKTTINSHLREKATNILNDWNVSIRGCESRKYCTGTNREREVHFTFKLFVIFLFKIWFWRKNRLSTFLKHQTTCLLEVNPFIAESTRCKLFFGHISRTANSRLFLIPLFF